MSPYRFGVSKELKPIPASIPFIAHPPVIGLGGLGGGLMSPSGNMEGSADGDLESPFHPRPPVPGRNVLISPPGSPPVGWEQAREEPPNGKPLLQILARPLLLSLLRAQLQLYYKLYLSEDGS